MSSSKSQEAPPREACDECHTRKIRCPSATSGACLNCRTTGRICTFSPRKGMGRPKNSERKKSRRSDVISPPTPNDAVTALPMQQTNGNTATGPNSLGGHDFFQDFSYNATEWIPSTAQEHNIMSNNSYRSYSTSNISAPAVYQDHTVYHQDPNDYSSTNSTMSDLFHPCATTATTTPAESVSSGHTPNQPAGLSRNPSQDIFTRLSSIQMGLWKRKDHHGQNHTHTSQDYPDATSSNGRIDDFIQTASDICSIAEAGWNHHNASSSSTNGTSSHEDCEVFYFQLMMSVSAALDILSNIEGQQQQSSSSASGSEIQEQHQQQNNSHHHPNFIQMRSSFFILSSLQGNEHLNMLLTLTTLDFYLGQMATVLSKVDMVPKIDGLRQGVDDVVRRIQQFRHFISNSLGELRGGG